MERSEFILGNEVYLPLDEDRAVPVSEAQIICFVAALARALHAFVTYPRKSPARDEVVLSVQKALLDCNTGSVVLQITNDGIQFDGDNLDVSGNVEQGLVLLLRRAFVAALEIDTTASNRDLSQFCEILSAPDALVSQVEEFSEILKNRGVSTIQVHVISSHQTIEAGAISADRLKLVEESRQSSNLDSSSSHGVEGGWVRVDPSVSLGRLKLSELPLVLPDVAQVAVALRQLNGRRRESMHPEQALVTHFRHVAALYESVESELEDAMYTTLADAVSNLPEPLKTSLFRDELLPALVDGNQLSRVLTYLPDAEIAGALPSLLELGVGGVNMLSIGLSNLAMSPERKAGLLKLLEDQAESSTDSEASNDEELNDSGKRTDSLLTLNTDAGHELAPLAGFDLSVDEQAAVHLAELVRQVEDTDTDATSLRCHTDLAGLVADPSIVTGILRRSRGLFIDLESRGCIQTLADAVARYAIIANGSEGTTDEIAFIVQRFLAERITPEFVRRNAIRQNSEAGHWLAQILTALGDDGADLIVATLQSESDRTVRRQLLDVIQEGVGFISSGLVAHLGNPNWYVVRNVLRMLGYGGPGPENSIANCLHHEDPRVLREAFLALARIASPDALSITIRSLQDESRIIRERAAYTIWRFPPSMSHPAVREVLADRKWLLSHPVIGRRLIKDGNRRNLNGLSELVPGLGRWRLAFWDRQRMELGREAWKAGRKDV
jgi:hypothetical protein